MCLGKTVFTTCLWSLRSSFYILTWRGTSLLIHSATFLLITLKGYNFIIDFTIHLNWSKNSYYRANTLNCKLSERSYAECFAFIDTILNLGKLVGFILFFPLEEGGFCQNHLVWGEKNQKVKTTARKDWNDIFRISIFSTIFIVLSFKIEL